MGTGLVFAGVGLLMLFHGFRGFLRKRAVAVRAAERPDEPWYYDHTWAPEGVRFSGLGDMWKKLWFALVWLGFTGGFAYLMFRQSADTFGILFIGIFTLVGFGVLGWAIYDFARWCKFGSSRLRFGRFPFLQGETLEVYWSVPRGIKTYNSIDITLRAIEEKYETRGSGKNRSQQVVMYEIYNDHVRFDKEGELPAGSEELPITFPLPTDVPPTLLSERPPIYWEIEVKADAPGIDYYARFLVPVYAGA